MRHYYGGQAAADDHLHCDDDHCRSPYGPCPYEHPADVGRNAEHARDFEDYYQEDDDGNA